MVAGLVYHTCKTCRFMLISLCLYSAAIGEEKDGINMMETAKLKINEKNHLVIGGCDCVDLAREYGTPLYVMDETVIRDNMRVYKNAMDKYYGGKGRVLYIIRNDVVPADL